MKRALLIAVLGVVWGSTAATADTRTWTGGAGDKKWESPGNWSGNKVPGAGDDVVIPPDSGEITTNGQPKSVKSLEVRDSPEPEDPEKPKGTHITGAKPGDSVIINASGEIYVGARNTVTGCDGGKYSDGGNVYIKSTGGNVTNRGTITGGNGHSGKKPTNGGHVRLDGKNVTNKGMEAGGAGGDHTGTSGPGANGGNVHNEADEACEPGKKVGGRAGTGYTGSGKRGLATTSAHEYVLFLPGDWQSGDTVSILVGPGGLIDMAGLPEGAIQADTSVFIDAGGPDGLIILSGIPAGVPAIIAGESICVHGTVLLDPGVELADITEPAAFPSPDPCPVPPLPNVPWWDDFDVYPAGEALHDVGDWIGWAGDPAAAGFVTDALFLSEPHALEVAGPTDLVHEFVGADSGRWVFSAWQYIPGDFSSGGTGSMPGSYLILLNTYEAVEPYHWSVQMQFDSNDGLLKVYYGNGTNTIDVPYVVEEWAEIAVVVDLDDDWTEVYYDDELVAGYAWTGGVLGGGGGALSIAAVDLYAHGSTAVFYDDLFLQPPAPFDVGDLNCDGLINAFDIDPFVLALTDPELHAEMYPDCDYMLADINGDGLVNAFDIDPFVQCLTGGG